MIPVGDGIQPADHLLAGEYALGVLSAERSRDVERRIAADAAFATLMHAWERRLYDYAGDAPEVTPPPVLWRRIEARL